jgi:beta-lactamase class D
MVVIASDGSVLLRSDAERCAQRLRPYSTFKIPNSMIALETGVVEDESFVIAWNQQAYPKQSWWPAVWTSREHDLASAFEHSFVPYFRQAAARIGAERMARFVRQFRYGNQSIDGSIDSFWLDGGIAISADEQVRFLRDFYYDRLGVSARTTRIVKQILVRERRGAHVISAKTGSGDSPEGGALGWLVGYVERGDVPHFFAFHASGSSSDAVAGPWRYDTVGAILAQLGLWPAAMIIDD